jgi:CRISPR/Cas system-associated exonuclease Cas4 (RecB family)
MDRGDDDLIRASELSQYAYCARAWWLGRVMGYRSANVEAMQAGAARHRAHGRAVEGAYRRRRLALTLLVLAAVALAAALAVWLIVGLGG